jgi:hypothetical protein
MVSKRAREAVKSAGMAYHVCPAGLYWAVRRSGSTRASARYGSRERAVSEGKILARRKFVTLYVHGSDGRIERRILPTEKIG